MMNTTNTPADRDAARLLSVGIEADGLNGITYATGAESGAEFEIYRTPYTGWGIIGEGAGYNFPALVKFLQAN